MAEPPIGRDEELNASRAVLAADRVNPAIVVLEGGAGIGKTTVWEAAIAAESSGRRVLRASPAEAEMAL
jgi:ATP-dependent Clp protease ATP-binding subunit ClpA